MWPGIKDNIQIALMSALYQLRKAVDIVRANKASMNVDETKYR